MSALPKLRFTPQEYLALEAEADYKSQYVAGEIFAMAGAHPRHITITGNLVIALGLRFRGRACQVFFTDMRLQVTAGDLYTYPDVMALCGRPTFSEDIDPPSLLNPQVIIEVLSRSTEAFDRGDKFARCRRLESLTDYVLVSAERRWVEHHRRQPSGTWTFEEHSHPTGSLRLASVGCEIPLAEIYDKVEFSGGGGG